MLNPIEKFKVAIFHLNRDWNHWYFLASGLSCNRNKEETLHHNVMKCQIMLLNPEWLLWVGIQTKNEMLWFVVYHHVKLHQIRGVSRRDVNQRLRGKLLRPPWGSTNSSSNSSSPAFNCVSLKFCCMVGYCNKRKCPGQNIKMTHLCHLNRSYMSFLSRKCKLYRFLFCVNWTTLGWVLAL